MVSLVGQVFMTRRTHSWMRAMRPCLVARLGLQLRSTWINKLIDDETAPGCSQGTLEQAGAILEPKRDRE